jgi:putative phosphoesterase
MDAVLRKTHRLISAVAHLGDGWDEIHALMLMYPFLPLYAVEGNCDYESGPGALTFYFASKKFIITHGHRFQVKSGYLRIGLWARENEADVCLFGHTHIPEIFYSGKTLMMNPGSIGMPKPDTLASYGIVDVLKNGVIESGIMFRQGKSYKRID